MTTIEKAIDTYGKDMQLTVATEEFSELIKELCKNKRGADNREAIIEEVADCRIMLEQIRIMFNITPSELDSMMARKLSRLTMPRVTEYAIELMAKEMIESKSESSGE